MTTPLASLSSSLGSRLLAGAGTLALLTAVGLFSSRPAHSGGGPVPVTVSNTVPTRDADNAARQPFQRRLSFTSTTFGGAGSFTVPAGKQLVLENISASAFAPSDREAEVLVTTTAGGQGATYEVGFATTQEQILRVMPIVPVRLYADGGTQVTVNVARNTPIPANNGYGDNVSLSGYLVDVP